MAKKAKERLFKMVTTKHSDGTAGIEWEKLTLKHLGNLQVKQLTGFIRIRLQSSLAGDPAKLPSVRGTVQKVNAEIIAEDAKSRLLIK